MRVVELRAGRRGRAVVMARRPDAPQDRAPKQFETALVREQINVKTAAQKLELLLYANFSPRDWFVTLTYDDAHLPPNGDRAQKRVQQFNRRVRERRRGLGQDYKYVYVTEGLHGEARLHHHMIVNATDDGRQLLRDLWRDGMVEITSIQSRDSLHNLAKYMSKEPRKTGKIDNGKRMYTPSKGLLKEARRDYDLLPGETYEPPEGAQPFDGGKFPERISNNFGTYTIYDFEVKN